MQDPGKIQDPRSKIQLAGLLRSGLRIRCKVYCCPALRMKLRGHHRSMDSHDFSANREHSYDLSERTYRFARAICAFLKKIPRSIANEEYSRQLIRSSASVGANYLEANDALGANDFAVKIKTSRREAKETTFWIRLLDLENASGLEPDRQLLLTESQEYVRIFSAILLSFERNRRKNSEKS